MGHARRESEVRRFADSLVSDNSVALQSVLGGAATPWFSGNTAERDAHVPGDPVTQI